MYKTYTTPLFELVNNNESNKVFFAGSGPEAPKLSIALGSMLGVSTSWF